MRKIVKIRFKPAGKLYDFDCGAFVLNKDDNVIVETEQGLGLGVIAIPPVPYEKKLSNRPLKQVFRLANEEDFKQKKKNLVTEKEAQVFCLDCIKQLELKMNFFSVESTFDAGKLTFFFTSEGRVDFRQLVKMLVKEFGVRIEMRQVGIRNQAKMCGGIGRCGREICCSAFMGKFDPVSIRMAKDQSLSLNPTKISGMCGRLMCCLAFEHKTYQKLREKFPKIGRLVDTSGGKGKVIRHNLISNRLTVRLDSGTDIDEAAFVRSQITKTLK
ncbi:MAG: stage 0 sporulation protein [Desulfobacteraceae bacterium]|nr:stage 0 sporulation protein [Desulfobacteraceae bacterium]MBC2718841.1 stage 0 sporulation protein [Desulfobacteraceae bacterium]